MVYITVWGVSLSFSSADEFHYQYLLRLPNERPSVEWVWSEIDRVWDSLGLSSKKSKKNQHDIVSRFYRHPVWIMNGIFTASDPVSCRHRSAISKYIHQSKAKKIADFGGGFGELALAILKENPMASISVIEPFPSQIGIDRLKKVEQVKYVPQLEEGYDVVVAQDVLEHVESPVALAWQLSSSVNKGGCLIFANCFYPVIKCHLPCTFHLRHTFALVMMAMGLRYVGVVAGAEHALVFQRNGRLSLSKALFVAGVFRFFAPVINSLCGCLSRIKSSVLR